MVEMYSQFCQPMIFTVYTLAKKEMMKLSGINDCCSILVVSPLKSIINDQIADIAYESLGYTGTAVELSEETLRPVSYVA